MMFLQRLIYCLVLVTRIVFAQSRYTFTSQACKYEFVVNEMDVSKCPGAINSVEDLQTRQSDIPNTPPVVDPTVQKQITDLEEKFFDAMVRSRITNTTVANHDQTLKKMEGIISSQANNITDLQKLVTKLERKLLLQKEYGRSVDDKLAGVMLNVGELTSLVEKKLSGFKTSETMETAKSIEVMSSDDMTHCALSPNFTSPKDCSEVYDDGHTDSGIYYIKPLYTPCPIPVWCDMDSFPGGWLVTQRRQDGSQNFNQDWMAYRKGFGDVTGEFWLGNDNLFLLTNQGQYTLRIDLWDFYGSRVYAEYKYFHVDGERDDYTLHVRNHTGTAPDGFGKHDGLKFSASDRDNDNWEGYHCAKEWESGWWFNNCWYVILNGLYQNATASPYKGIAWNDWKTDQLKAVEMKIRPQFDMEP